MDPDINYIIQESLIGDKNSQEILLEKLSPLLYKNIYKYWNPSDFIIDDLVQEGFIVILQALKAYDKKCNVHFLHFVKVKVEYYYKNYLRNTKNQNIEISFSSNIGQENFELENIVDSKIDVLENTIAKENSQELIMNIKKLNHKEQQIIFLYYFENISLIEISKILNTPYSTIIGKKQKALKKLKNLFQEVM